MGETDSHRRKREPGGERVIFLLLQLLCGESVVTLQVIARTGQNKRHSTAKKNNLKSICQEAVNKSFLSNTAQFSTSFAPKTLNS